MNNKEKSYLRDLAKKVADIAKLPEQKEKETLWKKHNSLEKIRPLVLISPEGSWTELLPEDRFVIKDPFFRQYETNLKMRIYYHEHLKDDSVIDDKLYSTVVINNTGWGIETKAIRPEELRGSEHYEPVIKEEKDIEKIKTPQITIDPEKTEENYQKVLDVFGDILKVEKRDIDGFWFSPLDWFATWRGFDNLFLDLVERPKWLHSVMERITDGYLSMIEQIEKQGGLSLNNGNNYVGSGGYGFIDELPQKDFDGIHVRAIDMWGHATTQIFSLVSPAMHNEFALTYEKRVLSKFGLNCYGCCEPLHKKLQYVKDIPRLRRISMSPWVNLEEGAKQIEDKYIFSYKPNPAIIAAEHYNPDNVRKHAEEVLEKTKGCVLEMIMKDTHTCRKQPYRMDEWVKITKETVMEKYG